MRFPGSSSIGQKLQAIVMIAATVPLLLVSLVLTLYDHDSFLQAKTEDLLASAQMVGSNSTAALSSGDSEAAREILGALRAKPHVMNACIYDKNGAVFAKYTRDTSNSVFSPPTRLELGTTVQINHVSIFHPIVYKGEAVGTIFIESDLLDMHDRMVRFMMAAALALLVSLVIAVVFSARLQRVISEPIQDLARTAQSVTAAENYSIRATKTSNDEIGLLFDQFNGMLDRIQHRDAALQKAHAELELRIDERTRELQKEVAERKQAEIALENQKTFLNSVIENSPVALIATDSKYQVQMCNPAFENLFLYRQSEIVGRRLGDLVMNSGMRDDLAPTVKDQVHRERKRVRSDGSLVDVEVFVVPLTVEG